LIMMEPSRAVANVCAAALAAWLGGAAVRHAKVIGVCMMREAEPLCGLGTLGHMAAQWHTVWYAFSAGRGRPNERGVR